MDFFHVKDGVLHAEDVPMSAISEAVGTPVYIYSASTIIRHIEVFKAALLGMKSRIFYSVKANSNQAILALLAQAGVGMDVVSIGEYKRARAAGVSGNNIVFSGVGKTRDEMRYALENGIYQFNVESDVELELLNEVAVSLGLKAPIAFRVNPDVDAKTHPKISTGKAENKFGIHISDIPRLCAHTRTLMGIELVGLDMHIGSQLVDLDPFRDAFFAMRTLYDALREDGFNIMRLDLGGGLGIPYERSNVMPPLPMEYGALVRDNFGDLDLEIGIEPGRLIMGNAGVLLSQVIYEKKGLDRNFLIVDAAMNDLIRPSLYDAYHEIVPVQNIERKNKTYDVVGPVCETGDTFAKACDLPEMHAGELLAFRTAGAYGAVMASTYNTRALVPEVLVWEDHFACIRERQSVEDLIARDQIPYFFENLAKDAKDSG